MNIILPPVKRESIRLHHAPRGSVIRFANDILPNCIFYLVTDMSTTKPGIVIVNLNNGVAITAAGDHEVFVVEANLVVEKL